MKPKGRITEKDYLKAMKKASRDLEIELHGKQITTAGGKKIHQSEKAYKKPKYKTIENYEED